MPKSVTKTANVSKAFGQELGPKSFSFDYTFEELVKGDEIPEDEIPSAEDILGYVNQLRNSNARSAKQSQELTAREIKPLDLKDNPAQQLKNMIVNLVASGRSQEDAEKLARQLLNVPAEVSE